MKAAHAAELTAADENHRRETDEHTTALDALRAQLTDTDDQLHHAEARATDLDTQLTEARQMLADAQATHAAELTDAQATHAAELTEMKAAHAAELADVSDAPLEDHTAPLAADTPATPEADEPEIPQPPIESLSLLRRILTGSLRSAPDAEGRHREQRDVTTQPPRRSEP
jgi:hypothetical protein